MESEYCIKLTLALYKVSKFFPQGEPLKFSIREKANEILADLIIIFSKNPIEFSREQKKQALDQISTNIDIIQGYFEVAKKQGWVKEENFFVLGKEYDNIKKDVEGHILEREAFKEEPKKDFLQIPLESLKKDRHRKILEILKERGTAQVKNLKEVFPELSKRTLRRDFEYLLNQGLVERIGDKSKTLYKLK